MSFNLRKLVIGSHLFFSREGTIVTGTGGGTVGPAYKAALESPAPTWPAQDPNWPILGIVEEFTPTPKITEEDIMAPSPGAYRRVDSIVTSNTLDLGITLRDVSELFFEPLFLAQGPITGDYQPLSGTGQIRGWLKAQQYSQDDIVRNVFDVYVAATVKATKMDNKLIKASLDAKCLFSPLNTGVLSLA